MTTISVTLQNVNGDPASSGGNINITTQQTPGAEFYESSGVISLETVLANDTVTIGGVTYSYEYLGFGYVRGDPLQPAAFIRITSVGPDGTLTVGDTFAIDLSGQPGDPGYPDLSMGNTQLTVDALSPTIPNDPNINSPLVPCFVAGTLIETAAGPRPVETIRPGDRVWTLDDGFQPVDWAGQVTVPATGAFAPVEFAAGTIGNSRPLRVSQQHRMLLRGWQAELYCGEEEVLVAAVHMLAGDAIRLVPGGRVTYVHLLFDRHQIVEAEGALSESLYLGTQSLRALPPGARDELAALFPDLAARIDRQPTARHVGQRFEARVCALA